MDVIDLSYKVKIFHNQVLEVICRQQFGMKYPGIPCGMNERQRCLLANAMAHKKASKRCSIATINLCRTNKHYEKPLR